jgi:hypothetical protein
MPSPKPLDFGRAKTGRRSDLAPVERANLSLGQFTANTTVVAAPRVIFDRKAVIREIWLSGDAVPADADGTMLVNALLNDISEGAADTLVSSADLETIVVAANKGYSLTLATETSENELTVEAGDTLRFTLVNNSAAINTNANIAVSVLYQTVVSL